MQRKVFQGITSHDDSVRMTISLPDGLCVSVSPNIESVLEITPNDDFYTKPFVLKEYLHPTWNSRIHLLEDDLANDRIPQYYVYPLLTNNKLRWVQQHNSIVNQSNKKTLEITIFDITDLHIQQKKCEDSEKNFKNIFDASADSIIIHATTGEIIEFNREFAKITNGTIGKNQNIYNFFDFTTESKNDFLKKIQLNSNSIDTIINFETNLLLPIDTQIPVEVKSRNFEYTGQAVVLTLIRDVSTRKELEKKLLNTIVETEEKERQRLAIDLHDEIGPLLSSMKMYMQLLKGTKDAQKSEYITNQLLDLVKEAITSTREISNSLSPHVLSNYGLIPAMTNMMDNIRPFITVEFKTNCDTIRFDENIETVYYRIFKELCNNSLKHAKAKKIEISLKYSNNTLYLQYSDNGIGFSLEEKLTSKKDGIGLFNILSRVQAINGEYEIITEKGQGFKFELRTKSKTK